MKNVPVAVDILSNGVVSTPDHVALLNAYHLTSPDVFLKSLHILYVCFVYTVKIIMCPSLPPPGQVVPIVTLAATYNGQMCVEQHFGCRNMLLLAWTTNFGRMMHLKRNGTVQTSRAFCSL